MPLASLQSRSPPIAGTDAFAPLHTVQGPLDSGVLLLCDHASNALPPAYGRLGLPAREFERHIAYDIGAARATEVMADLLGAPALFTTYSRLLIDPNRGADDPTLVMRLSDGAIVPGNARIDAAEIEHRRRAFWQPYHDAIEDLLSRMAATGVVPAIVAMHSFTPFWKDVPRPWHIGLLWDNDPRLAGPLLEALAAEPDLQPWAEKVGDNEPYDGALPGDTIDTHATRHGLANVLIEVRQDLMTSDADAEAWGRRLARLLAPILRRPDMHEVRHHPARTGPGRRLAAL
jgi:predicted N-formylglutamate amidohydrolase